MRTLEIHLPLITALAVPVLTGSVTAQDKPSAVLNSLEVQQLVKRGEPADSGRLAAQFAAHADRYVVEAKRHTSMAQSSVADLVLRSASCLQCALMPVARLQLGLPTKLRELAAYHQQLASGVAATPPVAVSKVPQARQHRPSRS